MAKKVVVLTDSEYWEIINSRDWCRRQGFVGLQRYYDEELTFQARRGALPPGAAEYREEPEVARLRRE